MEFNELLYKRISTRAFKYEKVSEAFAIELIEAGTRAPNACNMQSWHFYPIIDKSVIEKFYPEIYGGQWITDASALIIVCTEKTKLIERFGKRAEELFMLQDTAAAMQNILLAATDRGYASCWVGAFDEDKCRVYLDIPDNRRPVAIAVIGRAAKEIPLRDRRPLEAMYTFIGDHKTEK